MKFTVRAGVFFLLGLLVYFPALRGEFIMDDWGYITQNPLVRDSSSPWIFWSTFQSVDYWPLSYTLYWSLFRLFGENPLGYHLLNLLIHSFNASLLWTLALTWPVTASVAGAMSALFFLHPLHVQAVAWMIQSKTLIATFFFLLATLWARQGRTWGPILAFALSLLSKTAAVTAPFVFLKDNRSWKKSAPFFVMALVMGGLTVYINSIHFNERTAEVFNLSWYDRAALMLQNLMFYLSTFIFPAPLAYMYPFTPPALFSVRFLILLFAALAVGGLLFRSKGLLAGRPFLAGYLILIFPALGAVSIPNMKLSLVADHWAYLPNVFMCLAGGAWLSHSWHRPVTRATVGVLLLVLAAMSFRHAGTFASELTFWQQALRVNPNSAVPYYNLGTVYGKMEQHQEALNAYEKAIALDPNHARAWYNKGRSHFIRGELVDAKDCFLKAAQLDPKIDKAYTALAKLHLKLLNSATAVEILEQGLKENPDSLEIRQMLSEIRPAD